MSIIAVVGNYDLF